MPETLRTLALLNICPPKLYELLMQQPNIAAGQIKFVELEKTIMAYVHRRWGERTGINAVEPDTLAQAPEEFELNGEIYRLEQKIPKIICACGWLAIKVCKLNSVSRSISPAERIRK